MNCLLVIGIVLIIGTFTITNVHSGDNKTDELSRRGLKVGSGSTSTTSPSTKSPSTKSPSSPKTPSTTVYIPYNDDDSNDESSGCCGKKHEKGYRPLPTHVVSPQRAGIQLVPPATQSMPSRQFSGLPGP